MSFESGAAAVAGAISGAGLLGYGFYLRSKLSACQSWPQTTGTITKSVLNTDDGYEVSVSYEYAVNGVGHSCSRLRFGTPTSYVRKGSAEAAIRKYPVNSRLTVYYNPENPAEAVVDRTSPGGVEYMISGIILLIMSAVVIIYPGHGAAT